MIVFGGNGAFCNLGDVGDLERLSGDGPTDVSGSQSWGELKNLVDRVR